MANIKTFAGARKAMGEAIAKIGTGFEGTVPPTIWAMQDAVATGEVEHLSTLFQDMALLLPPSVVNKWGKWVAAAIVEVKHTAEGFEVTGNYAGFTYAEGFEFSKVPAWYVETKKTSAEKVYSANDIVTAARRQGDLLVKLAGGDKKRDDSLTLQQIGYMQAAYRRLVADLEDIKGGTYQAPAAPAPAAPADNVVEMQATGTNG